MSQIGRMLIDERAKTQKAAIEAQAERELVSNIMKIKGMIARLEDELIDAERTLEKHRGKKG